MLRSLFSCFHSCRFRVLKLAFELAFLFLDNGFMMSPKRRNIISLLFTCLILTSVLQSYFEATTIDTVLYEPIVLLGWSGIFCFIFFFRSSDMSPTIMSIHLIWAFSVCVWSKLCRITQLMNHSKRMFLTLPILHQVELDYLHNHVISGHRQYISCLWFCTSLAGGILALSWIA